MKKFPGILVAILLCGHLAVAQRGIPESPPKLVVGIVVDQMRNEFLLRYWNRFSGGGFRRLAGEGFYFRNTHFNYIPTYTGPGHASVYTGSTPRHHGIVGNDWYERTQEKMVYCAADQQMMPVGTGSDAGRMSPHRLMASTVTDELKLATMKKGKVFAFALKDRGAVLPGGHMADGAFWLDEEQGRFVTSSFYTKQLPGWLEQFNNSKPVQAYLSSPWVTLYALDTYTVSLPDNNEYESLALKSDRPVFPYDLPGFLKNNKLKTIRATPFGNSLTLDAALHCLTGEKLGKDEFTDFLSVSFSSTDIIGHAYGPRAIEVEDTYLRLDLEIERLLKTLDREVGKDNYVIFLTADHGVGEVPRHLSDEHIPAGYIYEKEVAKLVKEFCQKFYNDSSIVTAVINEQIYLDTDRMGAMRLDLGKTEEEICRMLGTVPGVAAAYGSSHLKLQGPGRDLLQLLQNGYHGKRSGQIAYLCAPGFMDYSKRGSSHGSGYTYDTHVPLIFFGKGIPKGEDFSYVTVTQIAPTISELLRIGRPGACFSDPLNDRFRR